MGLGTLRRGEEKDLTQRSQREERRERRESAGLEAGLMAATVEEGPTQPFSFVQDKKSAPTTAFAIGGSYGEVDIEDAALKGRLYEDVPIHDAPVEAGRLVATVQSSPLQALRLRSGQEAGPTTAGEPKDGVARMRFFRAPGGVAWPWQLRLARERGYTCVLGCAYPHDPMRPPVAYIRWLIEKNLRPGTIVILHDGIRDARRSVAALPQILEEGTRRGLRFVSVGELVDSRGEGG